MADLAAIYCKRPRDRMELQNLLQELLGVDTDERVQYQPPEGTKLKLPNITYRQTGLDTDWANNKPYIVHTSYDVTIKDKNPDSPIAEKFKFLPLCRFIRLYTSDNYNAWVYRISTQV